MVQTKRDYALSEAKWLSEAPADWRPFRLKEAAKVSPSFSGNGPDVNDDCSVVPMEVVTEKGDFIDYDVQSYDLVTPGLTNFEDGDVIFAKITPCMENGKGAFVEELKTKYAFGSTEFHVFRPNRLIDGKFLYYYTYDPEYRKYAAENMTGAAGQKRVSTRFVEYTSVFLPVISEQQLISAYLNKQCAAIDKVLESKREQLTVLEDLRKSIIHRAVTKGLDDSVEFVDSGLVWAKKVPKNWKITRIKDVLDFYNTIRVPLSAEERGLMIERLYDYYGASGIIDHVESYLFDGEYILLAEDGANIMMRNSPLAFIATGKFWVNNHAHILKPRFGNIKYYEYLLESLDYSLYVTGAAQPKLTKENLSKHKIVLPLPEEQDRIVDYLDQKNVKIHNSVNNIENQIDTLEKYRNSLIHECVTGKRRVAEQEVKELAHV